MPQGADTVLCSRIAASLCAPARTRPVPASPSGGHRPSRGLHHLRYSGWRWLTSIPAAMEATMTSRVVSMTLCWLRWLEQSSATRGHGEGRRSGFGSIELFGHQPRPRQQATRFLAPRRVRPVPARAPHSISALLEELEGRTRTRVQVCGRSPPCGRHTPCVTLQVLRNAAGCKTLL
jgi:hypothetical protein